ncbi:hypothetical protein EMA8858_02840 [Emticicia aquatica]|uniref:YhhN-like protein n=1 Tax=Emticicia aquatica TaxID=1681835 RepID=A0ABM9ARW3_9BACT|nr:hypothetical protein [Emticicia aquatica]CAH0996706.1 hypothetical protein EMA8858_02840 [Emticicia aquatica]
MTSNFVTFYLIIVLITSPFFQFLPINHDSLKWDDLLLAKMLNQAPIVFLLGYLISQVKKSKKKDIYSLLIAFLLTCIATEAYHFFIHPDNLFIVIVLNNIASYIILSAVFFKKINAIKKVERKIVFYAIGVSIIVLIGFSFSFFEIYKTYFSDRLQVFVVLASFIFVAIIIAFLCVLVDNPFKRTWYETIIGVLCLLIVDIYTYSCFFVFNIQPKLLYTYGKVIFSVGILLIVDGVLRKNLKNKSVENTVFEG